MAAPRDTSAVIEIPGPWQHRYVAANGARFHVVESAPSGTVDPPCVVLLHGFPEFWWSWRHQLPALSDAGYRAVAMDLRGYGGSDKTPRGYDPVTLARDVSGVVKALGERKAVVVGHGWGGYVGWATAVLHAREVCALGAVASPHPLLLGLRSGRSLAGLTHLLAMQVPLLPERRLADPDSGFLGNHLRQWSAPRSGFPDADVLRTYQDALSVWPAPHCALEYHRWLLRSRLRSDGRRFNRLMTRTLGQPVCSVQGVDDPALPPEVSSRSARWVTGRFREHRVPDAGHFPHEEQPDTFNALLLGWLTEALR